MKQDEIIEMARQAHRKLVTEVYAGHMGQLDPWTIELLKIFAKLVAAKEREACANICLGFAEHASMNEIEGYDAYRDCEEAIRARGQK